MKQFPLQYTVWLQTSTHISAKPASSPPGFHARRSELIFHIQHEMNHAIIAMNAAHAGTPAQELQCSTRSAHLTSSLLLLGLHSFHRGHCCPLCLRFVLRLHRRSNNLGADLGKPNVTETGEKGTENDGENQTPSPKLPSARKKVMRGVRQPRDGYLSPACRQ